MQQRYPSFITVLLIIYFLAAAGNSQAQDKITVSGAGSSAVNGTYTYGGISNGYPYYTYSNYRVEYRDAGFGLEWNIWIVTNTGMTGELYYGSNPSGAPVTSSWYVEAGVSPVPTVSNLVAFTDGTSYTAPGASSSSVNNPIGRFMLDPGANGSNLTSLTVQLSGAISDVNNIKLWSSTDNSFSTVSDLQLSSKTAASSVAFTGLSSPLAISGTYYFITADVNAGATGNIFANIANASSLSVSSGSISTSFTNAGLSSAAVSLPLHLLSFTAQNNEQSVILNWTTTREENVKGFDIEQSTDGVKWTKLAFVAGTAGNNFSTVNQYAFKDENPVAGHSFYRLKMLDQSGAFTWSKVLTVKTSYQTRSVQCYPNPYTQSANIAFQLPVKSFTTLKVYNTLGVEVSTLMNRQLDAGNYTVAFDGTSLPAGLYMYTLKYGKEVVSGTILKK